MTVDPTVLICRSGSKESLDEKLWQNAKEKLAYPGDYKG